MSVKKQKPLPAQPRLPPADPATASQAGLGGAWNQMRSKFLNITSLSNQHGTAIMGSLCGRMSPRLHACALWATLKVSAVSMLSKLIENILGYSGESYYRRLLFQYFGQEAAWTKNLMKRL